MKVNLRDKYLSPISTPKKLKNSTERQGVYWNKYGR